jgi:hypothetical protein
MLRPRRAPAMCALAVLGALMASQALAGEDQDREDFFGSYTHRIEGVTVGAGDAPASNTASQIINPWPAYAGDRRILTESPRMIGVIRRYHTRWDPKSIPMQTKSESGTPAETGGGADANAKPATATPPSDASAEK